MLSSTILHFLLSFCMESPKGNDFDIRSTLKKKVVTLKHIYVLFFFLSFY